MVNNGEGGLAVVNSVGGDLPMMGGASGENILPLDGGADVGNVLSDGAGMTSHGLLVSDSFADQMCNIGIAGTGRMNYITSHYCCL